MTELFSKYRLYILLALAIVVALVAWFSLSKSEEPSSLISSQGSGAGLADKGLVDTLLQLRAVSLGGSIFSDPAFANLRDFGTQIVPESVGRPNPFAPVSARTATTTRETPRPQGR